MSAEAPDDLVPDESLELEDERKKTGDVDPLADNGTQPDDDGFSGAGAPPLVSDGPAIERAVGPVPAGAEVKPVEGQTLDRCLILGIMQAGLAGFFKARDLGLLAEHLDRPENGVYEQFERFIAKNRLPTETEIQVLVGVKLAPSTEPYDVETFASKIITRTLRNKFSSGLKDIMVRDLIKDPAAARDSMGKLVRETAFVLGSTSSYTDPSTAQVVLDDYLKAKSRGGGLLGLSSPWPNVDKHSLGLQEGELTVILAKRKQGKSFFLLKWALHSLGNDLKAGENLLVVSMEMPAKLCYRRLAAIDLKLDYKEFRSGTLTPPEEAKLQAWVENAKTIDPTKPTINVIGSNVARNVSDIAAKVAELRPRGVFIDGLYILGRGSKLPMWERQVENVSQIKLDLCAMLNVPVLATTQFKGSKDKNELSVDADDAAYAKAIGDWADAMRGIVCDVEMDNNRKRLFVGMESREFKPVDILVNFDLRTMNFDEIKVVEATEEFSGAGNPGKKGEKKPGPNAPEPIITGTTEAAPTGQEPVDF